MLLQQLLEKIMRKKKFSKLVSSCQYYCLLGTVHTTSSAGGFDCNSLITKHSHENTGINAKNSVLKQAKMVSIYHKTISGTLQRDPQ